MFRGVKKISTLQPQQPIRKHSYVMGVDWGKSNDFTVLSVVNETTRQQVYLDRFNQISWALQRGRLMALQERFKCRLILAELNSIGEPNVEQLRSDGLPIEGFQTTLSTKTPLIDGLSLAIEQEAITLLDDPIQVHELQSYEMNRLPSGIFRYSAPDGGHDDTVIALALAVRASIISNELSAGKAPDAIQEWFDNAWNSDEFD